MHIRLVCVCVCVCVCVNMKAFMFTCTLIHIQYTVLSMQCLIRLIVVFTMLNWTDYFCNSFVHGQFVGWGGNFAAGEDGANVQGPDGFLRQEHQPGRVWPQGDRHCRARWRRGASVSFQLNFMSFDSVRFHLISLFYSISFYSTGFNFILIPFDSIDFNSISFNCIRLYFI